ncbi:hypothetical protein RvY_17079 [Ramazzottius varieornatus]|uniref:Uncharacterized protein n=1 Tax=Ramazzottius varieornatus TaxID=947166 RepID=A0A1D1W819_RAMVA|nr:hypothetical protein RvY_17079 [Ramazzottius varieornatus]
MTIGKTSKSSLVMTCSLVANCKEDSADKGQSSDSPQNSKAVVREGGNPREWGTLSGLPLNKSIFHWYSDQEN